MYIVSYLLHISISIFDENNKKILDNKLFSKKNHKIVLTFNLFRVHNINGNYSKHTQKRTIHMCYVSCVNQLLTLARQLCCVSFRYVSQLHFAVLNSQKTCTNLRFSLNTSCATAYNSVQQQQCHCNDLVVIVAAVRCCHRRYHYLFKTPTPVVSLR